MTAVAEKRAVYTEACPEMVGKPSQPGANQEPGGGILKSLRTCFCVPTTLLIERSRVSSKINALALAPTYFTSGNDIHPRAGRQMSSKRLLAMACGSGGSRSGA
jgi:hypothetical protein